MSLRIRRAVWASGAVAYTLAWLSKFVDRQAKVANSANAVFAKHKSHKAELVNYKFSKELAATYELRGRAAALASAAKDMQREAESREITALNVRYARLAHIRNMSL